MNDELAGAQLEARLRHRFRFTVEELDLNREGQLSRRQRKAIQKRLDAAGSWGLFLLGGAIILPLIALGSGGIDLAVVVVILTFMVVLTLLLHWRHHARLLRKPLSVTGPTRMRQGAPGQGSQIQVGPWWRRVAFPGQPGDDAIVDAMPRATVHYTYLKRRFDASGTVLSIEPTE